MSADPALRQTPLFAEHQRAGARFVAYAGWQMPVQFQGVMAEHRAVRSGVGLFDVSHMGRLVVRGSGALAFVDGLVTNDLASCPVGRAVYTCCCNDQGGVIDDWIVYHLPPSGAGARPEVLVVCNAANRDKVRQHVEARREALAPADVEVEDLSDQTALIAVQGPRALGLVGELCGVEALPAQLRPFGVTTLSLLGRPCRVARTGYTGEDGVEVVADAAFASELWRALLQRGQGLGVVAVGLAARDTLRLEARLALYGNELDESTNPFEAGLGWTVKFRAADFVGRHSLERLSKQPVARQLVGFRMIGRGIGRASYPLLDPSGNPIGHCTSGAPSPSLGVNIGLGFVPPAHAALGSRLQVDCRGRLVEAEVVPTPFYKRGKAATGGS